MVPILSLWLPILVAAILVFVASSVIHMVLKYHHSDYARLPDEAGVMDALRPFNIPPGEYYFPFGAGRAERESQEWKDKANTGPVAFINVFPNGVPEMGASLAQWFGYAVVVGIFAAYVAGRALGPGAEYLSVFRFTGVTAFVGYSLALVQASIWYRRSWGTTLKSVFDGLVYALLTAGAFGWLWPDS
jgi:hypothetical protein